MKKKLLTVAMAAIMVISSAVSAFAADTLIATGWWTGSPVSTATELADGSTVTFNVDIAAGAEAGAYAAFCVEATDGTNYMTSTSDGDVWGAGSDTDDMGKGVVTGGSYTASTTRSGNDFTVTIIDNATNEIVNSTSLVGNAEFGATTVYIMSQVGDLTVTYVASDSLIATGWWTGSPVSTALTFADNATVTFDIDIAAGAEAGAYAAFCVEATDGTNYMTSTSDGDVWGAGSDTDDMGKGVVTGGSYIASVTRSGNDFAVTIIDSVTNEIVNSTSLVGNVEFGATTVYIMSQVGDLTVSYDGHLVPVVVEPDEPSTDEPLPEEPSTDEPSTDEPSTDEPSTDEPATDVPSTGDGADEPSTDETPSTDAPSTGEDETKAPATDAPSTDAGVVTDKVVADVQESAKTEGENVPADSKLVVSNVDTKSDDYKAVVDIIEKDHKDKKFVTLDLKLMKENVAVQPNGKIKVTLPVVEDLKDAKMIQVYRIENGNKVDLGKVEVKDGKFTFETDHFSTYVFVEAAADTTSTTPTTPNTGDATMVGLLLAVAAISAVVVLKKRTVEQ